jgi:hypothetical protein
MVCKKGVKLMKFSDGNWLIREGFEIFSPVQFHDLAVERGRYNGVRDSESG